ncbi:O-antigen ligase family protein [Parerythrobacter aurantius]|uniref:O-antigen ligase family protein n=1 Tax=Parerythrobacter aurantius TaxID=3127706 RepID=UPI00324FC92B
MQTLSETGPAGSLVQTRAPLRLRNLGLAVAAGLLVTGIVFHTYYISVDPPWLEGLRQLGIVFILLETLVLSVALARGMTVAGVAGGLRRPDKVALAIFLACFLPGGVLFSEIASTATSLSLVMVLHMLFACAIWHSLEGVDEASVDGFARVLLAAMLCYVPLLVWTFVFPPEHIDPYNHVWQFALPGFISVRTFGAFTGALAAFLVALALCRRDRGPVPAWLLVAVTIAGGLTIWSGTRAAIVGVGVSLVATAFLLRWRFDSATIAKLVACLVVAVVGAVALQPYGDAAFQLYAETDGASGDAVTGGRLSYWSDVLNAIGRYPLFGAGSAASSWALAEGSQQHVQPHNIILQFLLSWGAIATAAALFLIGRATIAAHAVARQHILAVPFLAMVYCLLVNSLFDGTFYFARHLMLIMLGYGVIFAIARTRGAGEA